METESISLFAGKEYETSLHRVVNEVVQRTLPQAVSKENRISNEVESHIKIVTDYGKIRNLLKRILELINNVSKKSHIHISAKTYHDLVLVHFKENNIQNIGLVFNEIKQMVPEAEKLGGFLGITSHETRLTTIALTFLNTRNTPRLYTDRLAKTIFQTAKYPRDKH